MKTKTEIRTVDPACLKNLIDGSALTIEGLAESSIDDFLDWIETHTKMKCRVAYLMKGSLANSEWGLTGKNAYPDDLNIVSVKLDDMEDWNKIVLPRFQVGGRWLDDIYDNNIRREGR